MSYKSLSRLAGVLTIVATPMLLGGCASFGASGPTTAEVKSASRADPHVRIVELTDSVTRQVMANEQRYSLAQSFGGQAERGDVVGRGDVLDISIWEAPPAALFATATAAVNLAGAPALSHGSEIPSQMVSSDGQITVPFVGQVQVLNRTTGDIAKEIVARLRGKAHDPQAIVRIAQNEADTVTVVGDVTNSRRVPLSTKGERLLDALASAGGVRQPVDKVLIQITRGKTVVSRPLGAIIRDPSENVVLRANDVVTALYQPYSFEALGALGTNAEVNFEGTGITLAQALGRVGGLQDNRANVRGLFIFRMEDPRALPPELRENAPLTAQGLVPVIYRVDLSKPNSFFAMQSFPMHNKDILYVSNAPIADLQKFVNLVSQLAFSVAGIVTAVP